jgi:hypothetical protein
MNGPHNQMTHSIPTPASVVLPGLCRIPGAYPGLTSGAIFCRPFEATLPRLGLYRAGAPQTCVFANE